MEFAQMENLGWGAAIAGIVGVIAAGLGYLGASINSGTRLLKRIDALTSQVFKMSDELVEIRGLHHKCEMENAELRKDLKHAEDRISHLENLLGGLEAASKTAAEKVLKTAEEAATKVIEEKL